MSVRVIEALPERQDPTRHSRPSKLRVAAYCRVSTDTKEQKSSYEAQRRHYLTYIAEHPSWTLAGIFADEGISGTQARRRPEFLRMIDRCESRQIDLIITKSISRFARNTIDCLNYIRRLKELGIPVLFEKESINTMEASGEVLITILASLAQQESASISQNVKMGIRYIMREGRGRINYTQFLGYTQGPTKGSLVIVPDEARTVRRVFRSYLEGYSPAAIASQLERDGIPTPTGGTRWHASTIASMLKNEKYCGDLLLQKYFTPDFLTHKVVRNEGQLPQYFVENHHEPIVPKEVFALVQEERARRSLLRGTPSQLRFGSSEALRGRLVCVYCGNVLRRTVDEHGRTEWRCPSHPTDGTHSARTREHPGDHPCVRERTIQRLVLEAFNRLPDMHRELVARHARMLAAKIALVDYLQAREQIRRQTSKTWVQDRSAHVAPTVSPEISAAQGTRIPSRMDCLLLQRAELLHQAMQTRMLLELIDQMSSCRHQSTKQNLARPDSPSCRSTEDFFRRTAYDLPKGMLDSQGRMIRFEDDVIVRHLACIRISEAGGTLMLKAGIRLSLC